jgi:hypothetical protein
MQAAAIIISIVKEYLVQGQSSTTSNKNNPKKS